MQEIRNLYILLPDTQEVVDFLEANSSTLKSKSNLLILIEPNAELVSWYGNKKQLELLEPTYIENKISFNNLDAEVFYTVEELYSKYPRPVLDNTTDDPSIDSEKNEN